MQAFIEAKREEIAELCRTHHVRRLSLFGSAAREDFDSERSDVDFLVEFEKLPPEVYLDNKVDLHESFRRLFERKVDLLTWKSIVNPYLRSEVEKTHLDLYAA